MTAKRQRRRKIKILVVSILLLICLLIYAVDSQVRPIIISMAKSKAEYMATMAINDAIEEELSKEGIDYNSLVTLDYDDSNNVKSLHTDIAKLNSLKGAITANAMQKISSYTSSEIGIRVGNLLGSDFFAGRGPLIHVKLQVSSNAQSSIESEFESAGINQTRHTIMLKVNFNIYTLIPGYNTSVNVDTNFCLAETVIVGVVPDNFTHIDGVMSDDQFDAYGNYKAESY